MFQESPVAESGFARLKFRLHRRDTVCLSVHASMQSTQKTNDLRALLAALSPARVHALLQSALRKVRGGQLTPACAARSMAWGVFVGSTPLFGLHSLLAVAPTMWLRLDPLLAYLGSNISMPPMIPILLYTEAQVGSWLLHGKTLPLAWDTLHVDQFLHVSSSLIVGSLVVGALLALVFAALSYCVTAAWLRRVGGQPAAPPGPPTAPPGV